MQTYPPGTRIGQYEIASLPMMGGMGVVYFALDHGNDGRPVALKTFRPEFLPDRAARDRFLREGTAWVELGNHPHIVRCYKVEYIDPTAFLVLELIAKEQNMPDASLRSWLIPGHPLPIEQALLFALQIARGMHHATEKIPGFVHRDLKPENILVGADKLPQTNINRLLVTDFGLVKTIADSGISVTTSNTKELKPNQIQFTRGVGTPLYMAPEQWKGEPVGVFTDVYAFGCMLYEIFSGQYAAKGNTLGKLQRAHCDGRLQPIPVSLPQKVVALIMMCVELNPANRYNKWSDILTVLDDAYFAQSGQSAPPVIESTTLNHEDELHIGWSYKAIGKAYLDIGNPNLALRYFNKALSIISESDAPDAEGSVLNSIGDAYRVLGDIKLAIDYFEQSLLILRKIRDRHGEAALLGNLGVAYRNNGDIRRAINYFEESLVTMREIGDKQGEANTLLNLGNAFANNDDFQQAINHFEPALAIMRETGNRRGEGKALGNIGEAYRELGDSQKAIGLHEQSIAIFREIGDLSGEAQELGILGNAYADSRDWHKAIAHFERALEIFREVGDRYAEEHFFGNLGIVYKDMGETQKAIESFKQALSIAREVNHADGVARHSANLAKLYADQGESVLALPLAQEAARIWAQMGSPFAKPALQLVAQLQSTNANETDQDDPGQAGFSAFIAAKSLETMRAAVIDHPKLKTKQFLQTAEDAIKMRPELKPLLEQRLLWLKAIAKQQQPSFIHRLFGKKE